MKKYIVIVIMVIAAEQAGCAGGSFGGWDGGDPACLVQETGGGIEPLDFSLDYACLNEQRKSGGETEFSNKLFLTSSVYGSDSTAFAVTEDGRTVFESFRWLKSGERGFLLEPSLVAEVLRMKRFEGAITVGCGQDRDTDDPWPAVNGGTAVIFCTDWPLLGALPDASRVILAGALPVGTKLESEGGGVLLQVESLYFAKSDWCGEYPQEYLDLKHGEFLSVSCPPHSP